MLHADENLSSLVTDIFLSLLPVVFNKGTLIRQVLELQGNYLPKQLYITEYLLIDTVFHEVLESQLPDASHAK